MTFLIDNTDNVTLLKACLRGDISVVETLLDCANLDCQNYLNRTPLMIAIIEGHSDIAIMLLNNGAKLDLLDHEGNTAADLAYMYGQIDVISHMKQKHKKKQTVSSDSISTSTSTKSEETDTGGSKQTWFPNARKATS